MAQTLPETLHYGGPAWIQLREDADWHSFKIERQEWDVIEFCPYEPAAYCWEDCFLVVPKWQASEYPLYSIAVADLYPEQEIP